MSRQSRSSFSVASRLLLGLMLSQIGPWRIAAAAATPPPPGNAAGAVEAEGAALQAAQALLDQHRFAAAAVAFSTANETAGGKCGRCLLGLARTLEILGQHETALTATRDAVAALAGDDPLLGGAYRQLGDQLLLRQTRPAAQEAEDAYTKLLQADESLRADAWAGIAEARLQLGLYSRSLEAAEQSLAVSGTGYAAGKARSAICRAQLGDQLPSKSLILPTAEPLSTNADPNSGADAVGPGEEPVRRVAGAVSRPRQIYAPPPSYTEMARKARFQGTAVVKAIIDRNGCITRDALFQGLPYGLDRAAMEAVEKFVFAPAKLDGKPVRVYYTLTVNFRLE